MKSALRVLAVLALVLVIVPLSFADSRATSKKHARTSKSVKKPAAKKASPAPAPKAAASMKHEEAEAPKWLPMPATTGGLGLFTLETGETLPKKGFSISSFVDKFSRSPGDVTVLRAGLSFALGITDRATLYVQFDPHRHIHVGNASELSLATPTNGTFQQFDSTFYRSLLPCAPPAIPCVAPGYVEDYPFASTNGGGVGDVHLGVKWNLAAENRGAPVSFAIHNEVIIPTRTGFADLLNNTTQTGTFGDQVGLAVSKHVFDNSVVLTFNWSYEFTRDPVFTVLNTQTGATQKVRATLADQMRAGVGVLLFPEKRVQFMSEYSGLIFVGDHTPNTSFGPRDPVDTVTGIRFYPARWFGVDIGYRSMLNLTQHHDRNGFVIKMGVVDWPEAPKAPDNLTASCSVDKNSLVAESGEAVNSSVRATDAYNHPLTYTWTATGGKIYGSGPDVRWDSTGVAPGSYVLTARVDDGAGNNASCSSDVRVEPKPIPPPTMTCSVDRSSLLVGERAQLSASVNDQSGTPLTYTWQTNGGQIVGSGSSVQLDTSGVAPGTYTVTGRAENGKGGAADCTTSVTVQAPPPQPQAAKLNECFFRETSARVDNVCKRILDDVALRLQNDPKAKVVVIGYSTPKTTKAGERAAAKLANDRAANAQKYLSKEKGVTESRIELRTAGGQKGAGKQNNRADIIWVPEGASF
jgi:outer membrane protein OmpA-like peptidoglycan-associated protein